MYLVRDMIKKKGAQIWFVQPESPNAEALKLLAEKDVGALLVMKDERLVGIISERDFVRRMAEMGLCDTTAPVSDYMTRTVFTVSPDQTIEDCMSLMTARRIRHLPVLEDERVVGVISIGDVVKASIEKREDTIHDLEGYIRGDGRV